MPWAWQGLKAGAAVDYLWEEGAHFPRPALRDEPAASKVPLGCALLRGASRIPAASRTPEHGRGTHPLPLNQHRPPMCYLRKKCLERIMRRINSEDRDHFSSFSSRSLMWEVTLLFLFLITQLWDLNCYDSLPHGHLVLFSVPPLLPVFPFTFPPPHFDTWSSLVDHGITFLTCHLSELTWSNSWGPFPRSQSMLQP